MYHYETLGDERFQELCQSLLTATFPNIQCLPVGQPDGGREAYCWRRGDLDRRMDMNAAPKSSYPEILKATELLEKLIACQLGEDEERRRSAVRAYLVDQYNDDRELKFKQTELRSTMTALFV